MDFGEFLLILAITKFFAWIIIEELKVKDKAYYPDIPTWCGMCDEEHFDGMGGCWGISHGYIAKQGKDYCKDCEYCDMKGELDDTRN